MLKGKNKQKTNRQTNNNNKKQCEFTRQALELDSDDMSFKFSKNLKWLITWVMS